MKRIAIVLFASAVLSNQVIADTMNDGFLITGIDTSNLKTEMRFCKPLYETAVSKELAANHVVTGCAPINKVYKNNKLPTAKEKDIEASLSAQEVLDITFGKGQATFVGVVPVNASGTSAAIMYKVKK